MAAQGGLCKAQQIEIANTVDLHEPSLINTQTNGRRLGHSENHFGGARIHIEGDVRIPSLMMASEAARITAADGRRPERRQGDRRGRHADVELPQPVARLKAVQAFVIKALGLAVEIVRSLQPRNEPTLGLDRRCDLAPAVPSKVLVHLVAFKIAALVGFIGVDVGKRRQTGDVERLADRDGVSVRTPLHGHRPSR